MIKIKPKPCPFCGRTPELIVGEDLFIFHVYCVHCYAFVYSFDSIDDAIKKWNSREENHGVRT